MNLTTDMLDQLQKLERGVDVRSSDRTTDRARTKLKKLGMITFDRSVWLWFITDAGRAALSSHNREGE